MKRPSQQVAGGPRLREVRPAVAGRPALGRAADALSTAASLRLGAPMGVSSEDAELLADFADFMSGEEEELEAGLLPEADRTFKDRLRRRLWRTFVMGYLRGGGNSTH